ncbi:MAG TPA: Ig-like domain-containing protein, partial [Candidatus Dormibacteraeota bacterium]|nr:Ig-like domain-containing protein [Candidatus Dormibacteraeota bacterium]
MVVLRSKVAIVGAVVALAVAGTGAGVIYAINHAKPNHHTLAAPPVVKVGSTTTGSTTVGQGRSAEFLTVVNTTPSANAQGAAVNTPVTVSFNLPVWPASVQNFFSVLPAIPGTFGQGNAATDVVFTPSSSFATGSSVNVVIRQGLTSRDGFGLQTDYSFTFGTEVSDQGVSFQANNMMSTLVNLSSGRTLNVALQLGDQVPPDVAVKIYKTSSNALLPALVHSANGQYNSNPIDTSAMQLLDTKPGIKNNDQFALTEPDGVYLVLATSSRGQHGAMWLDVSRYGVLLRQDDQKVAVAGEDLTTGDTTPKFSIAFYKLTDQVQKVASGTFSGAGEFAVRYPNTLDLAIASTSGEDVVIPIATPATNADVKVIGDLSQQAQIFLTTDRAAYSSGDTAKFFGVVRLSNDQAYTVPSATQIDVWAGQIPNRLVDQKVSTAPDGTFSGSFAVPAGAFNPDGTDGQMMLNASLQSSQPVDFTTFNTVIQTLGPHNPAAKVTVSLDKPDYVASDTIAATITGPAGKPVSVTVYTTQHQAQPHELDAFPAPTTWGVAVKQNVPVTLDANGHGTYSVAANAAQVSADQQVTVTATYGSGSAAAIGARSTIVYQAADEVFLLASRVVYFAGETVNAPFVAETRSGDRMPNVPIAYEFDRT